MIINYEWFIYIFFIVYNSINIHINYTLKDNMYISTPLVFILGNSICAYSLYTHNLIILMGNSVINIIYSLFNIGQYIYYKKYYTNTFVYHSIH